MKFGRNRPVAANPHPHLARYRVSSSTPNIPPSFDVSAAGQPCLTKLYANGPDPEFPIAPSGVGDCTIAAAAHAIGLWTAATGKPAVPTTDDVITAYSACGGYIRGNDATDQGCDELVVLNYWKTVGIAGHQIVGAVTVNAAIPYELAAAIYLFGCVIMVGELPSEWTPTATGFTWGVAGDPIPTRGHCWVAYGYDEPGPIIDTWGQTSESTPSRITWNGAAKYCVPGAGGGCYAPISRDWLDSRGVAPNGYDLDQLVADAAGMGLIL